MKRYFGRIAVLLAVSVIGLTGCQGGPSVDELIRGDIAAEFDAVKADDPEFAEDIKKAAGDDLAMYGIDPEAFTEAYLEGFDYKVDGVDVDDEAGTAVAHVTMTCKSMDAIMADFQEKFEEKVQSVDIGKLTEDDFYKLGGEVMMACIEGAEPRDAEIDLKYTEGDRGEWSIDDSAGDAIAAAMMG